MSDLYFAHIGGHVINVGDISTVAPQTHYELGASEGTDGVKITFMSKATSIFLPGLTAEGFMDTLVIESVKLVPDN